MARVVHISTVHPPDDNRILYKELAALAEAGHEAILVARGPRQSIAGVEHINIAVPTSRWLRPVVGSWRAFREVRKLGPDLIQVHDPELLPATMIYKVASRIPAVYDAHENLPAQVLTKSYIPVTLRRFLARLAGALERTAGHVLDAVVISEPDLRRNYPTSARVELVQNFPFLRSFPTPRSYKEARGGAVYVGAVTPERGAVEMVQATRGTTHDVRLTVAGAVSGVNTQQLLDDAEHVTHLGRIPAPEIPALLGDSKVGLSLLHPIPNYLNSPPTKVFEYMAAARPVIYSDFPLYRQLFGLGVIGVAVDPTEVESVRSALESMLADPAEAERLGRAGRALFEEQFVFEKEAERLIALTNQLVGDDA